MTTISQTTDGMNDLYIGDDGIIAMSTGRQSYADTIVDAIRTLRGELQLETEKGIQFLETVFSSRNRLSEWELQVRELVESFDFVKGITSFTISIDERTHTLSYVMKVDTPDGEVEASSTT